jgi:drug/metabolite transporter (DMT)-like permease
MIKRAAHPEIVVAVAAAVWGLFWIPLREFERQGLSPGWVTISQFIAPLVLLLPFALLRAYSRKPTGIGQYGTGLLIGVAFALYCESLLLTDVVRALILFYVMPAWGTIVEVGLMGRRFTVWRGFALFLSLCGLLAILGTGGSLSLSFNIGDAMALISGIAFTLGAMRVRQAPDVPVFEQLFGFFFYGSAVAVFLALLPLADPGGTADASKIIALVPWFVVMAVGFLIPVMWGLYWGARFVDPGRLGILLQLEAVVGIGSAALFAGEPFGWREATGAGLVISAGIVEVFGNRKLAADSAT